MSAVVLLSHFTICSLMLYRHILQQPLGFVLCVKIVCKTYQSYLWAKPRGQQLPMTASFLGTMELSRPTSPSLVPGWQGLRSSQTSAAARAHQRQQEDSDINIHSL